MLKLFIAGMISLSMVNITQAETAEEKGLAIAKEVDIRDRGWNDSITEMKMVLRNQQGDESTRSLQLKSLEINGDGDKGFITFNSPRDVNGTALLSFSHIVKADDQWLYLPALKRVKRISSTNKSGPFMGSQFAYEDLTSFEVKKYEYKYLRDEKLNGIDTFLVENKPNYAYSGYTRQIVWVDKQRYIPIKIEYYDRKNDLLKTLRFNKYKQYLGKYWRALEQVMENHQNGKTTLLALNDYQFKTGLSASDFNKNSLKRAK
jgi:outer membrane lipoprotein-sorting protein